MKKYVTPKKRGPILGSASKPLEDGTVLKGSIASELQETSVDSVLKEKTRPQSRLSVMQGSLPIPKEMTSTDKLIFFARNTQMQNWLKKLEADSILNGGTSCMYWNSYSMAISQHLSSLVKTERCRDCPWLSGSVSKMELNSWFSSRATCLPNKNSLKISCQSSTASVRGFTDCESTKKNSAKRYKKSPRNRTQKLTPNSVKKLRVFPSKELHQTWKRWINAYRWIYNWTIAKIRAGCNESAYSLQKMAREAERPDWVKELPGHQLQEAVADAVDAAAQARANRGIPKFKSCRQPSQVVKFKAGNYKSGQWYPSKVKAMTYRAPEAFPEECQYGTQLVWERGCWFGIFPEVREVQPTEKSKVIALDPGVRAFLTGYDGDSIVEIGSGDIGKIQRLCHYRAEADESNRLKRCQATATSDEESST